MRNLFKTQNCTWSNIIKIFPFYTLHSVVYSSRSFSPKFLIKYFNKQIKHLQKKNLTKKHYRISLTSILLLEVRVIFFFSRFVLVALVCCVLIPKLFRLFYLHSIGLCWMLPFCFNTYDLLKSLSSDSKLTFAVYMSLFHVYFTLAAWYTLSIFLLISEELSFIYTYFFLSG